jgi:hypothetical protein
MATMAKHRTEDGQPLAHAGRHDGLLMLAGRQQPPGARPTGRIGAAGGSGRPSAAWRASPAVRPLPPTTSPSTAHWPHLTVAPSPSRPYTDGVETIFRPAHAGRKAGPTRPAGAAIAARDDGVTRRSVAPPAVVVLHIATLRRSRPPISGTPEVAPGQAAGPARPARSAPVRRPEQTRATTRRRTPMLPPASAPTAATPPTSGKPHAAIQNAAANCGMPGRLLPLAGIMSARKPAANCGMPDRPLAPPSLIAVSELSPCPPYPSVSLYLIE